MTRTPFLALSLFLLSAGCGAGTRHNDASIPKSIDGFELREVRSTEEQARVSKLLPSEPSKDESALLLPFLPSKPKAPSRNPQNYLPDETVAWVVTAGLAGDPRLDPKKL